MDDNFYSAFFPGSIKILGYQMRSFCLAHRLVLMAIKSPLLAQDDPITPADLLIALKVCSSKADLIEQGGIDLTETFLDRIKRYWLEAKRERFQSYALLFLQYVQAHTIKPKFWRDATNQPEPLTAPEVLSLVASLVSCGIPERDAWQMSEGRAAWLEAAIVERQSTGLRFLYQEDIEQAKRELKPMTEEEAYQTAVRDLGQKEADAFFNRARKQNGERN